MYIGSHVSFDSNEQLIKSVKESISYNANTFMFYTGAPQNTKRCTLDKEKNEYAKKLMKENNINLDKVICHAPYIVNIANDLDDAKYNFSIHFLKEEIKRVEELGVKYLVIHPGSSLTIERNHALNNISFGINKILSVTDNVTILLETMAGKGSECGINISELKTIIDGVEKKDNIGVCLDTCHLNDSGVDLTKFDDYLLEFS